MYTFLLDGVLDILPSLHLPHTLLGCFYHHVKFCEHSANHHYQLSKSYTHNRAESAGKKLQGRHSSRFRRGNDHDIKFKHVALGPLSFF